MATQPVILILTASAGAGHLTAARALEQAFRKQAPDSELEVLDVLAISNGMFRQAYAGGYLGLVRYAPAAMGWLYDTMDRPGRRLYNTIRIWIQNFNKLPTTRYVRQRRPRLIVNTHYLPAEIVAQMRNADELDCPQVTITTDYETHRLWAHEPTERYYTATPDGKAYLTTLGVAPERIVVTGLPVRPGFEAELERHEACRRCALDPAKPIVLLLCGGFGVGPTGELLRELSSMPAEAQVVVIAGRNEKLRRRLELQSERTTRPVRVVGFTEQMHEWMRAADVVVTKPGGLTVAESLACGLPLVIVNPIPGQETRNSDYLLEHGAAIKVNNPRLLGHRVGGLLTDRARLEALRAAARAIARPHAAHDIAADALRLLAEKLVPART
ncbi:MAG: glycosyltransferase [Phycisphaerae bacterium]|nr:glycosyltransferase [Phycisphaerae bacterium]